VSAAANPPTVERVELAPGYSVARVVNGGWQLSPGHGRPAARGDDTIDALTRLVERGLTTFDCADIYGGVEELLGALVRRWVERHGAAARAQIQLHTKLVPDREDLSRVDRAYVERCVDRSLRRLAVECLDLVQLHWWSYEVRGYVDAALALCDLRRAGKIRHFGVTNFDVARLGELIDAGAVPLTHQLQYSLLDHRPEHGMVRLCRQHGIRLLCYGSLAGGWLGPHWHGRDEPTTMPANRSQVKYRLIIDEAGGWVQLQSLLRETARIAARHGADGANVALRYVLDRPAVAAVIVGAVDDRHAASNLRLFSLHLTDAETANLRDIAKRAAGPAGDVYGLERVPGGRHAAIMKYNLNRDTRG